jgi:hypothetical protein
MASAGHELSIVIPAEQLWQAAEKVISESDFLDFTATDFGLARLIPRRRI